MDTPRDGPVGDRNIASKVTDNCYKPNPALLTAQGSHVGNIIRVKCLKGNEMEYRVKLVHPFNCDAHMMTLRAHGRPKEGTIVRLELTDKQIHDLIEKNSRK